MILDITIVRLVDFIQRQSKALHSRTNLLSQSQSHMDRYIIYMANINNFSR